MGLFGALGIISNLACITILAPHTGERRVFRLYEDEKTGPDILGSSAVVVTSAAVWMLQSPWPDLLVAVLASAQLMWLAARTLRPALVAYQRND
jgi:Co/Zn/Cd efflux system component